MVDVEKIKELVERFARDLDEYLSPTYSEASVRKEFINPLFKALGWDVENKQGLPPNMREVLVDEGETSGEPDYAFRIDGQTKFFVEAKKPAESLDNVKHIMQAKSYAWNSKSVFIAGLTDFEGFKLYDASLKPDQHAPERGLIWDLRFEDYLDNLDKLAQLSKEEVEAGSLEKLLLRDKESKRLRVPVDQAFLEQLTSWREELAKSYKNHTPDLDVYTLNEVVQRLLDRLVFIRICEDRRIIPARSLEELVRYWKQEGKRRDLMQAHLAPFFHKQNERFNGEILLPHSCEIYPLDSDLLAGIIENLYFPASPYQFNIIGVEILGTIYERYLGKTLHVTAKRARLDDKPEVRKAGGVYYTPAYIVDYIVQNTLGKLLELKDLTSEEVGKLRILDPACGSGSFLLKAYDTLLDWHVEYYKREAKKGKQSRMIGAQDSPYFTDVDGELELTAAEKARILQNNIFGVDIDPQAVEITMMSLYIKLLEGEVHFPTHRQILPHLKRNVRCGNSLIGPDFYENRQGHLFDAEETRRINAFDWTSKEHGFGEIMAQGGFDVVIGNPPYIFTREHLTDQEKEYYSLCYNASFEKKNTYMLFMEKMLKLIRNNGKGCFIVPNSWLTIESAKLLRDIFIPKLEEVVDLNYPVFERVSMEPCIFVVANKDVKRALFVSRVDSLEQFLKKSPIKVDRKSWLNTSSRIVFADSPNTTTLLNKVIISSTTLSGAGFDVRSGLQAYEKGKGNPPQTADDVRNHIFDRDQREDENSFRYLQGKDVDRYLLKWSGMWLQYGSWLSQPREIGIFTRPRILLREITSAFPHCLNATFVEGDYLNNKSILNILHPSNSIGELKVLLGIMNCSLMSLFYKSMAVKAARNIFPKVVVKNLREFPYPKTISKSERDRMVELVERMLKLNKELHKRKLSEHESEALRRRIDYTDSEIDKLVFKLYNLTDEEIRIVESPI